MNPQESKMLFIAKFIQVRPFKEYRVLFDGKKGDDLINAARDKLPSDYREWQLETLMMSPKCPGCQYDSLGQRDHMVEGGCLA